MFDINIYKSRREALCKSLNEGLILFYGNNPVPMNYPSNTLRFRQDSNFLYYCGLDFPGLNMVLNVDTGKTALFGDDLSTDDIVWEGKRVSIEEMATMSGIDQSFSSSQLLDFISSRKNNIHYLPYYREDQKAFLNMIFNEKIIPSRELIRAVIAQRSIKKKEEIQEIESALEVTSEMHKIAMRSSGEGVKEQMVVGKMEGYALSHGRRLAYPSIFTVNGEILHNNFYLNTMKKDQLVLNDTGAESANHYASDITRTFPVNGKFNAMQSQIYNIVYEMQQAALKFCKPGKSFKEAHLKASSIAVEGLKSIGLMRGDSDEAVNNGAHALFFPHGLGHMLGLDVHDMEGLGEDLVGYEEENNRSDQFGLAYLRLSKKLESGFVITVEPGIYFIPQLIDEWSSKRKLEEFINYNEIKKFIGFGGIRIEDNVHITDKGNDILGPEIPKRISEIEAYMSGHA